MYKWIKSVQPVSSCYLCDGPLAAHPVLCEGCRCDLMVNRHACHQCGLPLDNRALRCGECQRQAPPFDRCLAPLIYDELARELVHQYKFDGRLGVGTLFAELIRERVVTENMTLPEALVPVPLHPRRLAERGFNQAMEMARLLGSSLGVAVDAGCVTRVVHRPAQSSLSTRYRRAANMRGVFAVVGEPCYDHVAVVDDVMTTGATVSTLGLALKMAGVKRVDLWVACRAALPG